MFLENEVVTCIKRNPYSETWDYFNEKTEIIHFPKRSTVLSYPPGILNSKFENYVEPSQRKLENNKEIVKWATHINIIRDFIEQKHQQWLFVIEDTVHLTDLSRIKETPGLTLFRKDASAYLIDRPTATVFLENAKIYYASLEDVFQDLTNLGLICTHVVAELPIINMKFSHSGMPFFTIAFLLLLILIILFVFCFFDNRIPASAEVVPR
jgi:hypothetical protein